MKYEAVFFDLDGTLTNSKTGIIRGIYYALEKCGIGEVALEEVESLIGPPISTSLQHVFGLSAAEAAQGVAYYEDYYENRGIYESTLYPGMAELLSELSAKGIYLAVATSKPIFFAKRVVQRFGLESYFSKIGGAQAEGVHSDKHLVIGDILAEIPSISRDKIVMIGDRKFDIEGAKANGIDTIAVSFGYGEKKELEEVQPTYIVHSAYALQRLLIQ